MQDNGLPIPDNDLNYNDKIKYNYGPYIVAMFCHRCRYFNEPYVLRHECCPRCGSQDEFKPTVGQYKVRCEMKGLIFKRPKREIFGFTPKTDDRRYQIDLLRRMQP